MKAPINPDELIDLCIKFKEPECGPFLTKENQSIAAMEAVKETVHAITYAEIAPRLNREWEDLCREKAIYHLRAAFCFLSKAYPEAVQEVINRYEKEGGEQ